jgi:hypothetical protein
MVMSLVGLGADTETIGLTGQRSLNIWENRQKLSGGIAGKATAEMLKNITAVSLCSPGLAAAWFDVSVIPGRRVLCANVFSCRSGRILNNPAKKG